MKDWVSALREGDPAAAGELGRDEAAAMRRVVVAAAREDCRRVAWWPQACALAAVVALMVVASAVGARQIADERRAPASAGAPFDSSERRQLQFSTPGGTRIIWVFNSEFRLKETMP